MRSSIETSILLILVWCILNESFSPITLFTGLLMAIFTVLMLRLLFHQNDHVKDYRVPPTLLIWYFGVLILQIFINSLATVVHIYKHEINPTVVEIRTSVNNHWFQSLIANSITLTPGTVTIDKTDHNLRVLWLYPTTSDPEEQAKAILGPFENILKRGDYTK